MKKFGLVLVALLIATPLGGCESFFRSETVQAAAISSTQTSPIQASSLKAAGQFYVIGTHAATAALDAGFVSKDIAQKMLVIEGQLNDALKKGIEAERKGDSPGAAAALAVFNSNYATLAGYIPGLH